MPRFPMWWTTQAWIRQQRREPQARALRFSLKMRRKKSKSRIAGLFGSLLMCLVSSGVRKHALHFHQPFVEVFHVPSPFQWISCFSKWQGALGGRLLLWFSIQRSDFASWPRWFWHVLTHYHVYQSNKPVWSYLFGPDSHLLRWQPIPPWWLRWWLHWRYGWRTQSTQCSSVGWRVFVPCCQWCPRVSIACLIEQFQWTAMFGLYI